MYSSDPTCATKEMRWPLIRHSWIKNVAAGCWAWLTAAWNPHGARRRWVSNLAVDLTNVSSSNIGDSSGSGCEVCSPMATEDCLTLLQRSRWITIGLLSTLMSSCAFSADVTQSYSYHAWSTTLLSRGTDPIISPWNFNTLSASLESCVLSRPK